MLAAPIYPSLFIERHSDEDTRSLGRIVKGFRKEHSAAEQVSPRVESTEVFGDFAEYQRRMAAVSKAVALHVRDTVRRMHIRQGQYMHYEQRKVRPDASSKASGSKNRLSLPLSSFPYPSLTGVPIYPMPAPHPLPSPSLHGGTDWSDESSLEAFPIPSVEPEPEPKKYRDILFNLQPQRRPTPGPVPIPSPQDMGSKYVKSFSGISPEPSPELHPPKKPFKYVPFDYDKLGESGYNAWKAIYVFVRYMLFGH